jgi:hypothetical protein
MTRMDFDSPRILKLLKAIKGQYVLDWQGIHGISHWARVWENGMRLAAVTGLGQKSSVISLFFTIRDGSMRVTITIMDGEERSWQRSGGGNYSIWTMSLSTGYTLPASIIRMG